MENLLRDGDYVPNGFGGFTRLYGTQEVLARALFRLTCRRGSFPFLPELGSRLQELGLEKPSAREAAAKIFCASALRDMELEVDDVRLTQLPDGQPPCLFAVAKVLIIFELTNFLVTFFSKNAFLMQKH